MPTYEFTTDDEELVTLYLSFAEFDKRVKDGVIKLDDGRTAKYFFNPRSGISTCPSNYPMVSTAIGVHPSQVKDHMAHLQAMGCGQVNHTADGDVILESKAQRKKVCEALGFFDRNAGHGDPQPKHMTSAKKRRAKPRGAIGA
jgi:hypothetical protein